jgi:hypothetical protein
MKKEIHRRQRQVRQEFIYLPRRRDITKSLHLKLCVFASSRLTIFLGALGGLGGLGGGNKRNYPQALCPIYFL